MATCKLTGRSRMNANRVSHSNRKSHKVLKVNIRSKRLFDPETGTLVRMNVSTRALRTLARKGWDAFKKA